MATGTLISRAAARQGMRGAAFGSACGFVLGVLGSLMSGPEQDYVARARWTDARGVRRPFSSLEEVEDLGVAEDICVLQRHRHRNPRAYDEGSRNLNNLLLLYRKCLSEPEPSVTWPIEATGYSIRSSTAYRALFYSVLDVDRIASEDVEKAMMNINLSAAELIRRMDEAARRTLPSFDD